MPGMTGMELLTEMSRRSPDTVRMMLTAYSDLGPMVAAVNEGSVYRFFLKPWSPDEMRSAVADAVWLYEARAALQQVVGLLGSRKGELERTLDAPEAGPGGVPGRRTAERRWAASPPASPTTSATA